MRRKPAVTRSKIGVPASNRTRRNRDFCMANPRYGLTRERHLARCLPSIFLGGRSVDLRAALSIRRSGEDGNGYQGFIVWRLVFAAEQDGPPGQECDPTGDGEQVGCGEL